MSATVVSWEERSREQGMARALDRRRRHRHSEAARPEEGGVGSAGEVS